MTFSVDEFGEEYKFRIWKVGYEHCPPSKGPVSRVRPKNAWHFVLFGRGTVITADGKMFRSTAESPSFCIRMSITVTIPIRRIRGRISGWN